MGRAGVALVVTVLAAVVGCGGVAETEAEARATSTTETDAATSTEAAGATAPTEPAETTTTVVDDAVVVPLPASPSPTTRPGRAPALEGRTETIPSVLDVGRAVEVDDAIWVAGTEDRAGGPPDRLARIDAATGEVTSTVDPSVEVTDIAAGDGAVWVVSTDAMVLRVDATTGVVEADHGAAPIVRVALP